MLRENAMLCAGLAVTVC